MSSRKLIFNGDEVQRLQTRIGHLSQDTNRLYLQLKGQSSGWDGIPLGDRLVKAQVMINELTVEAEKLEDIIRTALKGVAGLQEENKRQADKLTQQFSLLAGAFGSFGTSNTAGRVSIPAFVQRSVLHLITSVTVLLGKDELNNDPAVQKLRNIIQTSGLLTVESIAALSKLKDIFTARDGIAKAQMAFKVYEAFGNKTQMEAVHAQAEEARRKLASLGVGKVQYEAGKDLSSYFKQPAVKACDYDPSITAESVPLIHNEEYLLLLRMAMEKSAAGAYVRSQLEVKRLQIEAAERKLALDSNTEAKKYNFEEYSKTLIGNTWVLSKNGITDQEAAQASIAYQEAVRNGEIKSNLDNVPVDIMQEQILAAKDGTNYWTGAKLSKLQAYGIIISSVVASFQGIEGMRGNVKIKRSLPLNPGAGEISASRVKKLNVPVSEGTGEVRSSIISSEMEKKILDGQRKLPTKNELIGGHSPKINNANPNYAVQEITVNVDGTRKVKFTTQFPDGNLSNIKTSTLFPESWSDSQIINSIKDTGNTAPIGVRASDGATLHRGTVNGVQVEVIKIGDNVVSGYPTGGGATQLLSGFKAP
ncbi:EndoU domain-containing protein [Paenibacillus phytohabitans]|uniref:EndoU domain-containing protein n=1 Tax=Paenibacillus phytohabitans TaxID=2654978 RepID=UPI00300BC440